MDQDEHRKDELQRLFDQQFGQPVEFWVRNFGIAAGSVLLYLYTGWLSSFVWSGLFLGCTIAQYALIKFSRPTTAFLFLHILISHLALIFVISMPVIMFISDDDLLRSAGGVTLAGIMIYLVNTADRLKSMIIGQVIILGIASVVIILSKTDQYIDTVSWLGQVFSFGMVVIYVGICLFAARQRRIDLEVAASRTAQAQKMEAIGHVSGGIAHHFNNLLAVIIGNIELCDDAESEEERQKLRNNAHAAALNGKRLVQLMLEFTGQEQATLQRLSAQDLLDRIVTIQGQNMSQNIVIETEPPNCHVLVDKDLFLTAMIHLVSNALDAMGNEGKIEIEVSHTHHASDLITITGRQVQPGEYVAFSVRDTGHGITQAHMPRVVEPFFTTKPVGKGAGLGLSMAAGFAEKHGGGLLIDSSATGTTATILLPTHSV